MPLVDGCENEWECSSCAVTNAVDRSGMCCGMFLARNGLLSSENMIEAMKVSIILKFHVKFRFLALNAKIMTYLLTLLLF